MTVIHVPKERQLLVAFYALGFVGSLLAYGVLLEYATSGGRQLHELSFVMVTCLLYAAVAAACRLWFNGGSLESKLLFSEGLTVSSFSVVSLLCSLFSLRYVSFPVQVLAKTCKPLPVMIVGLCMGERYSLKSYLNVGLIISGMAMFLLGNIEGGTPGGEAEDHKTAMQVAFGLTILLVSLMSDGATGAYEDQLMRKKAINAFDLMLNIQTGKSFLAFALLVMLGEVHELWAILLQGSSLFLVIGMFGALGQVIETDTALINKQHI